MSRRSADRLLLGGLGFQSRVASLLAGATGSAAYASIGGPVVSLIPFHDEDEVVEMANATDYGLSASVWTRDLTRGHRLAERIDSGTVWVNCWLLRDLRVPFGGMKSSGLGREGGAEALRFFTEPKNVCISMSPA